MKERKQCGNCVGIFSLLSESSTVLCVVLYGGWVGGGRAVLEHAVLFIANTERVSLLHLFHCRWSSMWPLKFIVIYYRFCHYRQNCC